MLKHCVFLNFKPEFTKADRTEVFERLSGLAKEIDGLITVDCGENLDFENKSTDYSHGFIATFTDRQAHLEYEAHPEHLKAGARLVEMCIGGHNGIIVFDLDIG